ncbi:MAG: hypothetical protein PHT40_00540 [Patescibacteria group bacterium]|nr:hypothetical protein [Patescibacteria group bacterium]
MTVKTPKEIVLELIEKSTDATLQNKGRVYTGDHFLKNIEFSDVMDLVLYYISRQPDLNEIAKIEKYDFQRLIEEAWEEWRKKVEKQWEKFYEIDGAWNSEPGAGGGGMGAAEHYTVLYPGFRQHDYLLAFFLYPEDLPTAHGNWPAYRKYHIEQLIFPKWRREMHRKKLELTFQLAEMVCQKMRQKK